MGELKVFHSVDGLQLEQHLVQSIVTRSQGGLNEPVVVLAPSLRSLQHLKWKVASKCASAIGVHFYTHRSLALKALEFALERPPSILPSAAHLEIVSSLLSRDITFKNTPSGSVGQLLSALRDLREAGYSSQSSSLKALPPIVRAIYPKYLEALETCETQGYTDEPGFVRRAIPFIQNLLTQKKIETVFHASVYELVGSHIELLLECQKSSTVQVYVPGDPSSNYLQHSNHLLEFLHQSSPQNVISKKIDSDPLVPMRVEWIQRLEQLFEPQAYFSSPSSYPKFEIQHSQGSRAELEACAMRLVTLHNEVGIPYEDMAVVARNLKDYAHDLDPVLGDLNKIPFTTSLTTPVRRRSRIHSFFTLLRALSRNFERRMVVELLRTPWVHFPDVDLVKLNADHWDRESRKRRIHSGLKTWQELIQGARVGEVDEDDEVLNPDGDEEAKIHLLRVLEFLEVTQNRWKKAHDFHSHQSFLVHLFETIFSSDDKVQDSYDEDRSYLEELLRRLKVLEDVGKGSGADGALDFKTVEERLSKLVDGLSQALPSDSGEGLQVLDLMQARGLTRKVILWLGFQKDQFPRKGKPNPLLSDSLRKKLNASDGVYLYPRMEAQAEESLLLASTLGSVSERLILSFQRADDEGSQKGRSSFLREVARAFLGKPDASELLNPSTTTPFPITRIPAHRGQRALVFSKHPHFQRVSWQDALIAHSTLSGGRPSVKFLLESSEYQELVKNYQDWNQDPVRLLEVNEEIDNFQSPAAIWDGVTSIPLSKEFCFSPTSLERLSRCPHLFFLNYVLDVRELDPESIPHHLEASAVGTAIHDFLNDLFLEFKKRGYFPLDHERLSQSLKLTDGWLTERWPRYLKEAAGPSYSRLNKLYDLLTQSWSERLKEFLTWDLNHLFEAAVEPVAFEERVRATITSLDGHAFHLAGRLDRLFETSDSLWVDDYKTSGKVTSWTKPGPILKGHRLQLPIYRELLLASNQFNHTNVQGRLLSLDPRVEPDEIEGKLPDDGDIREGFLETLNVVLNLAQRGHFPAPPETESCGYCAFRRACRHSLEPTKSRYDSSELLADYRDCQLKSKRPPKLTLADVRMSFIDNPSASKEGKK